MMKGNNKQIAFLIVLLTFSVLLVVGTTYALFTKSVTTNKILSIKSGTKYIGIYGDNKDNIVLNTNYNFSIENRGSENASYNLYITDVENNIGSENINYTILKNGVTKTGVLSEKILDSGNLKVGEKVDINIVLTSSRYENYIGRIKVSTRSSTEDASGAQEPKLVGDMIPVTYDIDQKSWIKADTSSLWYNYEGGEWANAVTIKDITKREDYKNAKAGEEINMKDVNAMWVWIPRYSYALGNTYGTKIEGTSDPSINTPGSFNIKFITQDITDSGSGTYNGETVQDKDYLTPNAFCIGETCDTSRNDATNLELSGIWISKFEITGSLDEISSIPNANSIKNETISSFYNAIQTNLNGENGNQLYGLSENYDAHMIKNTEWQVMSYLSQSQYGKYGNLSYSEENKEIYMNNYYDQENKTTLTGCSSGSPSTQVSNMCAYFYDTMTEGTGASTTGNIYGIYDTNGGASEQVMANYKNNIAESGFTTLPEKKYSNLYNDFQELTMGFYEDNQLLMNDELPFMNRGGSYNSENHTNGIFNITANNGQAGEDVSTRITLYAW